MGLTYQQELNLKEAVDRAEIGAVTARHNRAYEDGDLDAWVATFRYHGATYARDGHEFDGAALRDAFDAWKGRIHLCTDAIVEIDGVTATQSCRFVIGQPSADGSDFEIDAVGRYEDRLLYERGAWYLDRREATVDAGRVGA